MIAVYGIARLLNDGLKRHQTSTAATAITWIVSAIGIVGLFLLAIEVLTQSAQTTNSFSN